jgi:[FeFe] hydrogenase (group B1/B3)
VSLIKKFDTRVQFLKYKIIREVAKFAWNDELNTHLLDIPKIVVPDGDPTMRCCIYKERAIVSERVKMAMGGDIKNSNVIEVIDIACDECPMGGYNISKDCRGCIAHRCADVCPKNAILFEKNRTAIINKEKCIECGKCAKVCPFNAITNYKRPCEKACKVKAITTNSGKYAKIDNDKCIACGACVYQCPWGAIMDKSFILDAISIIKKSKNNNIYKVYAIVAPSISSQFTYVKLGKVLNAIKALGFYKIIEAALGADIVALEESKELVHKGRLMSSCCPAFVDYVKKQFPDLVQYISVNPSPAVMTAIHIKKMDPNSKIIFIGPCTAKKQEFKQTGYIDVCLTFEELQALFDSKNIDLNLLNEDILNNASYFGRIFARTGGLSSSVSQGLIENNIKNFELKALACNGIEECKIALLKFSKNALENNFIEGMVCVGGCIGGAGCLTHEEKDKRQIDEYGKQATNKTMTDTINKNIK